MIAACQTTPVISQPSTTSDPRSTPSLIQNSAAPRSDTEIATVPKNRSTVVDYFLAIPAKYVWQPLRSLSATEKQQQLSQLCQTGGICDLENGYISLTNDSGGVVATIFSRPSRSAIVAIFQYTTLSEDVVFLDPDRNWQDVTREIVPEFNPNLSYELPRIGTAIAVRQKQIEEGRPTFPSPQAPTIYRLTWQKGVFERSR